MDTLLLLQRGSVVAAVVVGDEPIEIGSALGCDLVVLEPALARRHWLLMPRRGTPVLCDVSAGNRTGARPVDLPLDRPVHLAGEHFLLRTRNPGIALAHPGVHQDDTEDIGVVRPACGEARLVVGRGAEARCIRIADRPVGVGRHEDNAVVLSDRAVSPYHLRLEPTDAGLVIRDLESRNGTYLDGARVCRAVLANGSRLRVGRTDLRVFLPASVEPDPDPGFIACSAAMLGVLADVRRAASLDWPVLICGESGTGKEGLSRVLHESGLRNRRPMVTLNAGGMPVQLVESELFGHERGAFTGAQGMHRGVFEQADGGTLFLDEIGELPLELQPRLLRVLETGEVRRVGTEAPIRVDVRLVCATHRDLRAMVAEGSFRADLYYRIARLIIEVPPLRSRPEDVRALCAHFLAQIREELGPRELTPEALARLVSHQWPGNARELRNVLSAACASTAALLVDRGDVQRALSLVGAAPPIDRVTLEALRDVVEEYEGNLSAAARALGLPRSTLRDRLRAA